MSKRARTPGQQMLSPLRFVLVKYAGKRRFGYMVPGLLGVGAGVGFFYMPCANVFGVRGLVDMSSGLLSMLVGFFVASLGLTLTLQLERFDKTPGKNPPTFRGSELKWREFAQMLTAYLVFLTLSTYLLAVACLSLAPAVADGPVRFWLRAVLGGVYVALFSHILFTTLYALFLMSEKVPGLAKPEFTEKKRKNDVLKKSDGDQPPEG